MLKASRNLIIFKAHPVLFWPLKLDLKKWNLEEFGNVAQKINSLLDSITTLDAIEKSRPLFGN